MAEPEVGDVLGDITDDVRTIVRGEIALAKAELAPQAKRLGIGAGLFGAAGYFAMSAATLLFITGGLALSALFMNIVPVVWAFTLGVLSMAIILLVLAGVLVLIGKGKMSNPGPKLTLLEANRTIDALTGAVAQAGANVRAIVAGAPRTPRLGVRTPHADPRDRPTFTLPPD